MSIYSLCYLPLLAICITNKIFLWDIILSKLVINNCDNTISLYLRNICLILCLDLFFISSRSVYTNSLIGDELPLYEVTGHKLLNICVSIDSNNKKSFLH